MKSRQEIEARIAEYKSKKQDGTSHLFDSLVRVAILEEISWALEDEKKPENYDLIYKLENLPFRSSYALGECVAIDAVPSEVTMFLRSNDGKFQSGENLYELKQKYVTRRKVQKP